MQGYPEFTQGTGTECLWLFHAKRNIDQFWVYVVVFKSDFTALLSAVAVAEMVVQLDLRPS